MHCICDFSSYLVKFACILREYAREIALIRSVFQLKVQESSVAGLCKICWGAYSGPQTPSWIKGPYI